MLRIIPKNLVYIYYRRLLFFHFLIHYLLRKRGEAVQFDDNIMRFLDREGGEEYLIETIRRIWDAKRALKLLKEPVPDAATFDKAELLFAVTGWPKGNTDDIRKRLPETLSRTVRVVVSPTKELFFDNGISL